MLSVFGEFEKTRSLLNSVLGIFLPVLCIFLWFWLPALWHLTSAAPPLNPLALIKGATVEERSWSAGSTSWEDVNSGCAPPPPPCLARQLASLGSWLSLRVSACDMCSSDGWAASPIWRCKIKMGCEDSSESRQHPRKPGIAAEQVDSHAFFFFFPLRVFFIWSQLRF